MGNERQNIIRQLTDLGVELTDAQKNKILDPYYRGLRSSLRSQINNANIDSNQIKSLINQWTRNSEEIVGEDNENEMALVRAMVEERALYNRRGGKRKTRKSHKTHRCRASRRHHK